MPRPDVVSPVATGVKRQGTRLDEVLQEIYARIDQSFPEHLERVRDFLRQPSVSALGLGLVETAAMVKAAIEEAGGVVELAGRPQAPIVFGRFDQGKPKTLLMYGMYDVQPADEHGRWSSPPFAAEIHELPDLGPCIIARGALNSKAPLMGFLNTLQVMTELDALPLNLKLTIEGEEEIGSPTLPTFYRENKERLRADAAFEPFFCQDRRGRPVVSLGVKGILALELECKGGQWGGPAKRAVHSSLGAWLASPVWRLVKALATLVDEDEQVLVDGFYADMVPPSPEEEELLARLAQELDEEAILKELDARRFKGDLRGVELLRRLMYWPCLNITGISAGYTGPGGKTIIPHRAKAKLDVRLVPNMEPNDIAAKLKTHLTKHGYTEIELRTTEGYPWARTPLQAHVVQSLIQAYRYHGYEPEIHPMEASATPYYLFTRVLNLPFAWGGLGHGGRSHSVDEYCTVEGLRAYEKSLATFLWMFASLDSAQDNAYNSH